MMLRSFLTLLLLPSLLCAAPRISEFMADNASVLADQDGAFSDWIEIHNPDATAVNLLNYALTDDPAVPGKWRFPAVALAAGERITVFASGKNRAVAGAQLHTNFMLAAGGEYLALVSPDGVTALQTFNPYPPQEENMSYGLPERQDTVSYLTSPGQVLVPASAAELAADWNQPAFSPGAGWQLLAAPPGAGFDTGSAPPVPVNISSTGTAAQSTTFSTYTAALGRNGVLTDFTHTLSTDTAPFWVLTFTNASRVDKVTVRNRGDGCCGSRLRDITVELLDAAGTVLHTSPLLNAENTGHTYPAGPASLEYDLIAATGSWVTGVKSVRVRRTADSDLSGSGGQGTDDERNVLSVGEVEVLGISGGGLVNLARTGSPAPTATQSSTLSTYSASVGIDGNTGNFTHTLSTDTNPTWTLNLQRKALISSIVINNRGGGCCQWRLRDITVSILDSNGTTVLYTSPLLNPENSLNNPATLTVDLSASPVHGQFVRIRRTPDPDFSGAGTGTSADDASVLSMGEVFVNGTDVSGLHSLIRTDLQTRMAGTNASAFLRIPFTVTAPADVRSLLLNARYDDGFAVWLNGTKVAERNAPGALAWNSAATASRTLAQAFQAESIPLDAWLGSLVAGQNVLAVQGLNVSAADGDFVFQAELSGSVLQPSPGAVYLEDPTPGASNNTAWFIADVADTVFSHKRGFYDTAFQLSISSATPGAQIYYTTDHSEPSPQNGTLVTGPVSISATTVVRARAYLDDYRPTNIDTHTFIFLADVTNKPKVTMTTGGTVTGGVANIPAGWPTSAANNGGQAFNWGFDTGVRNLYTAAQMRESLTQIPVISVVTQQSHLTDPSTGIYVNGTGHGDAWERPGSIEMLDISRPGALPQDGHGEFGQGCGLRIRGGASRGDGSTKHSFRVFFRKAYGAGKLAYRLYGAEGAAEFENFDLRGSQNYSWSQSATDANETMVRDPYARITLGAMGQPYTRSRYCHLFLNGLYWGIYDIHERADNSFGESYLGGDKTTYDGIKCGDRYTAGREFMTEATDGYLTTNPDGSIAAWKDIWDRCVAMRTAGNAGADAAYFRLQGRNPDGTRNPAWPVLIDMDNLIDYMLVIYWTGDGDAPLSAFLDSNRPNNWFSLRDRLGQRGFTFYNQDGEHTLLAPSWGSDRTGPWLTKSNSSNFNYSNPQWLQDSLALSPAYRLRFADRVRKHFFNGGALVSSVAKQRWVDKAAQINKAIRVYAARYSSTSAGETAWNTRINFIRDNFFDARNATVLSQLSTDQLWPSLAAPDFSQHGGNVPAGYQLTITVPAGAAVYYTTDGSDPRVESSGAIAGTATAYSGAVTLTTPGTVQARSFNGSTWSALTTAFFGVALQSASASNLNITEIHYNPADPSTPAELAVAVDADAFEFIEIANVSATSAVDLAGVRFTGGVTTVALGHEILAPGERAVFVSSLAAFNARYAGLSPAPRVLGVFTSGNLANGGEQLVLSGSAGDLHAFVYDDNAPWPQAPDGDGMSLTLIRPGPTADHALPGNWRASGAAAGSPGSSDSTGYSAWKTLYSQTTDNADTDGDGMNALLEYALGTSPVTRSTAEMSVQTDAGGYLRVAWRHSVTADDVTFQPETSTTLGSWTSAGLVSAGQIHHGDGTVTSTWTTAQPVAAEPRRFVRGLVTVRP